MNIKSTKQKFLLAQVLMVIAFIILFIHFIQLVTYKEYTEKTIVDNNVDITTTFTLNNKMKPSTLFPDGGYSNDYDVMMINLIRSSMLATNINLIADEEVFVDVKKSLVIEITAPELWRVEEHVLPEMPFKTHGKDIVLMDVNKMIQFGKINDLIEKIESEALIASNNYNIVVKPIIRGTVTHNNIVKHIELKPKYEIQLSGQRALKPKENISSESYSFKSESLIRNPAPTWLINNTLFAKVVLIVLMIFTIVGIIYLRLIGRKKGLYIKDENLIEKNIKVDIIEIYHMIHGENGKEIDVTNSKELNTIAQRRDVEVYKYIDKQEVWYFVLDDNILYRYKVAE